MTEKRTQEEIEKWAKGLVLSHGGSVSAKTIRGTVRYYLQWKEHGRYRSKYLRTTEVAAVRRQLALMRGKAVAESPLSREMAKAGDVYETNVCTGKSLLEFAEEARGFLTRDAFPRMEASFRDDETTRFYIDTAIALCAGAGARFRARARRRIQPACRDEGEGARRVYPGRRQGPDAGGYRPDRDASRVSGITQPVRGIRRVQAAI